MNVTSGVTFQEELVAQHKGSKPPRGGDVLVLVGWLVGWLLVVVGILKVVSSNVTPTKIKSYKENGKNCKLGLVEPIVSLES